MTEGMYDESPEMSTEEIVRLYDDLAKLNTSFLISRYNTIYKRLMRRRSMTSTKANVLTTCELISENNSYLLALLEDSLGIKFPS